MEDTNDNQVPVEDENQPVEETTEDVETEEVETEEESPDEPSEETQAEEPDEPAEPRKVFTMPVAKAQKEKQKAVERAKKELADEYEARIAELNEEIEGSRKPSDAAEIKSDLIEKVASEHNLDPKAAKEFAEAIISQVKQPDLSKYDRLLKEREVQEAKSKAQQEYDDRVASLVLKDNPHATPEHLANVRERVLELAFTEGYNAYRIEDIYKVKSGEFSFKNDMGAESPKGHGQQLAPFKKLTDEDEIKLADNDPQSYEKYLKWLEGQESKFL